MELITYNNTTFVIQGRIGNYTISSITSIKKYFGANCKIIISCWDSDYSSAIKLTKIHNNIKVISSQDPGGSVRRLVPRELHNINRIIASSKKGLEGVNTPYVVILRGDLVFHSSKIIDLYNKYNDMDRILVLNHTTIDTSKDFKLPFHCCEWLHVGKTHTLKKYFEIDLMPSEYTDWYLRNKKPEDRIDPGNLSRYMAEDYITCFGLRNLGYYVEHDYYCHYNINISREWNKILGQRYIVVSCRQANILNIKYPFSTFIGNSKSLTHTKWKKLAKYKVSILEDIIDNLIYFSLKYPYVIRRLIKSIRRYQLSRQDNILID